MDYPESQILPASEKQSPSAWLVAPSRILIVVAAMLIGIWLGDRSPARLFLWVGILFTNIAGLTFLLIRRSHLAWWMGITVALIFGATRSQQLLTEHESASTDFSQSLSGQKIEIVGQINSVPILVRRPKLKWAPRKFGSPESTRFLIQVQQIRHNNKRRNVDQTWQVFVDGNAAFAITGGDSVILRGKVRVASPPLNPGEFDYSTYLRRKGIVAQLSVEKRDDIQKLDSSNNLTRLSSILWHDARSIIIQSVAPQYQSVAMALLLGSRHELPHDVENAFVSSGTMHLLAISGLHVGILCMFLMKVMHALIVRRRTALMITITVCVVYALVTDLRPSVVRATVFFIIFAIGEFTVRRPTFCSLIATTLFVMLLWNPMLAFDSGAWLSFIAVSALAFASPAQSGPAEVGETPAEALTWQEAVTGQLKSLCAATGKRLQQMFAIVFATGPLVATQFHVVSLVGLLINVLLIAYTTVVLCSGFVMLLCGLLVPQVGIFFGKIFSITLTLLVEAVRFAADASWGHMYLSDSPAWFLPASLTMLAVIPILAHRPTQQIAAVCLVGFYLVFAGGAKVQNFETQITFLAVGQGYAAVVESRDGNVVLIDGGAAGRADGVQNLICQYIWHQGHRSLDAVILTQNSSDAFNAIPQVSSRVPPETIFHTPAIDDTPFSASAALLNSLHSKSLKTQSLSQRQRLTFGELQIEAIPFEAEPAAAFALRIQGRKRSVVFLQSTSEEALAGLCRQLQHADILVAPKSGAKSANGPQIADVVQPEYVIISDRDSKQRNLLRSVYATADRTMVTSNCGAIRFSLDDKSKPATYHNRLALPKTADSLNRNWPRPIVHHFQ